MSHSVLYEPALHNLLQSPTGPVSRHIDHKASQILNHAFNNIQSLTIKRTGDLLASVKKVPFEASDGHHVAVGADAVHSHGKSGPFPYAKALELGRDPLSGRSMGYHRDFAYMIPAVLQAGFRPR